MTTDTGRMCIPAPSQDGFDVDLARECAEWVGGEMRCSVAQDRCVISCANEPCTNGAMCDPGTKTCVFPDTLETTNCQEKGVLWGPCVDGKCSDGTLCFSSAAGDICVPPAGDAVAAQDYTCNGLEDEMLCDEHLGFCFLSCGGGPCLNGTVCDSWTNICVYAA